MLLSSVLNRVRFPAVPLWQHERMDLPEWSVSSPPPGWSGPAPDRAYPRQRLRASAPIATPTSMPDQVLPRMSVTGDARLALYLQQVQGLTTAIPVSVKSLVLRVARVAAWDRQMAAIWASKPSIGVPRFSRTVTTAA
jgi:hypothetical protein